MIKFTAVFFVATVLVVALIAPAQAREDDSEPKDPVCPVMPTADPDAQAQFETWKIREILPENREHSLIHEALDVNGGLQGELCVGSFCMVGIDTGGPGYCHGDKTYLCRECVRWETSGIEPVCHTWGYRICVHKGHCDSWD